jgi:hypothetical protein
MKQDVNKILEDLYRIDPNFKKYESELTTMVSELLASQPDTRFDQEFANKLRVQLMDTKPAYAYESGMAGLKLGSLFHAFSFGRLGYGVAGAIVALIIIIPLVNNQNAGLTLKQQVNDRGAQSFGTLQQVADGRGAGSVADMAAPSVDVSNTSRTMMAEEEVAQSPKMMAPGMGAGVSGSMGMTAPSAPAIAPYQPEIIRYVYEGEALNLTETEGRVFMRTKGLEA